jgi:energy-coupling factor transporter transmembrane protein EcfT
MVARFRAAAGAIAVLFARSYSRAEEIHRAMLARGFAGRFQTLGTLRFQASDGWFTAVGSILPVLIRAAAEKVA